MQKSLHYDTWKNVISWKRLSLHMLTVNEVFMYYVYFIKTSDFK